MSESYLYYKELIETYKKSSMEEYFGQYGIIEEHLKEFAKKVPKGYKELEVLAEASPEWMKIHLLSFCMKVSGDKNYVIKLLDAILNADYEQVGEYNKLSHYWQTSTAIFADKRLESFGAKIRLAKLYRELFLAFSETLGVSGRSYVPFGVRNMDLVFVFSSQVLSMLHAPTKTLLDRCYVLQKFMNKRVYIINTAMQITKKGEAPFYALTDSSYEDGYTNLNKIVYKDEVFDFFQCENDMPNLNTIEALVKLMLTEKPGYMINIGGSDICADICGMFVPEITVSTVFSEISTSCGEYQVVAKTLSEEDKCLLKELGVDEKKVKQALFTFSFKEQEHYYTKEQIGFTKNQFVLLVVGWRLDDEISEEFLSLLESVIVKQNHIAVAFMGRYLHYTDVMKKFPILEAHSKFLNAQDDALAVTECCDIYVNPKRNGGGSSVSEALYKGLPAVTLPIGDVSVAAGKEFWVADYNEMENAILRYASDCAYYEEMSVKARMRAEQLMDSKTSFCSVIAEIEQEIKNQGL